MAACNSSMHGQPKTCCFNPFRTIGAGGKTKTISKEDVEEGKINSHKQNKQTKQANGKAGKQTTIIAMHAVLGICSCEKFVI